MSRNSDPYFTGLSFCAAISVPESHLNCCYYFAIPDCCLVCSPEQENRLLEFLNWHIQYHFDFCYYPRFIRRLLSVQLNFKGVCYEHPFIKFLALNIYVIHILLISMYVCTWILCWSVCELLHM